jgi:hypothetical protein
MTTAELWRQMMGRMGWRVTCPGCGMVHDIATRERLVSGIYFTALPLFICTVVVGNVTRPLGRVASGFLLIGAFLVTSTLGTWLAARRLRLG